MLWEGYFPQRIHPKCSKPQSTLAAISYHSQWQLPRSEQVISLTLWPQNIFGSYSQLAAVKKKKENELFPSAFTHSMSLSPKPLPQGGSQHRCQGCSSGAWGCSQPSSTQGWSKQRGDLAGTLPGQNRSQLLNRIIWQELLVSCRPAQPGSPHQESTEGWGSHTAQTPPAYIVPAVTLWGCGPKHHKGSDILELWAMENINTPNHFAFLDPFHNLEVVHQHSCGITQFYTTLLTSPISKPPHMWACTQKMLFMFISIFFLAFKGWLND